MRSSTLARSQRRCEGYQQNHCLRMCHSSSLEKVQIPFLWLMRRRKGSRDWRILFLHFLYTQFTSYTLSSLAAYGSFAFSSKDSNCIAIFSANSAILFTP
mmetsp:Transcript_8137/g.30140  ORF Transcript_8137/g.30140 Transcript_8137/m.30140 type:complete len:100 (-) Transcript_8137:3054-3353(-)